MLHIRIKSINNPTLEKSTYKIRQSQNIDLLFNTVKINNIEVANKLINEIDGGTYKGGQVYIDRFGTTLPLEDLSTGCKAALTVLSKPTLEVDLTSSGVNARDAIIRHIRNGKILLPYTGITFQFDTENPDKIDVEFNGYRFTDIARLKEYIWDEWPLEPDLELEGITALNSNTMA